jgi:hypothetical protein
MGHHRKQEWYLDCQAHVLMHHKEGQWYIHHAQSFDRLQFKTKGAQMILHMISVSQQHWYIITMGKK